MPTFPIRRVRCGKETGFAWVTLWYNTGGRKLDVLHVVCDEQNHRIYIEGEDQAIATWGGAKRVLVGEDRIDFDLTKKSAKVLCLESAFALSVPDGLSGWRKARRLLEEMAGYKSGRCIEIA